MVKKKKSSKRSKKNVNKKPLNTMVPKKNLSEEKPMQVMTSNDFKQLDGSGIEEFEKNYVLDTEKIPEPVEIPKKKPKDEYEDIFQDIFSNEEVITRKYESLKDYDKNTKKKVDSKKSKASKGNSKKDQVKIAEEMPSLKKEKTTKLPAKKIEQVEIEEEESIDLNIDFDEEVTEPKDNIDPSLLLDDKITLATGFVNEQESKEIEDFLFDDIKNDSVSEDTIVYNVEEVSPTDLEKEEISLSENDEDDSSNSPIELYNNDIRPVNEVVENIENNITEEVLVSPEELGKYEETNIENSPDGYNEEKTEVLDFQDILFESNDNKEIEANQSLEMEKNLEDLKEEIDEIYTEEEPTFENVSSVNPLEIAEIPSPENDIVSDYATSVDNHLEENSKYVREISKTEKIIAIVVVIVIIILSAYLFISTREGEKVGNHDNKPTTTNVGVITQDPTTTKDQGTTNSDNTTSSSTTTLSTSTSSTQSVTTSSTSSQKATTSSKKTTTSTRSTTAKTTTSSTTALKKEYIVDNIMTFNQNPAYPTGCESVALYILLKHYNVDTTVDKIISELRKGKAPYLENGKLYGADPEKVFVGDPYDINSYGVYENPIKDVANKLRKGAIAKKGVNFQYVENILKSGQPLIAWIRMVENYRPISYGESWIDYESGKLITWVRDEHAVVVYGYSDNFVYISNPYTGKKYQMFKNLFIYNFDLMGGRIVYYDK